VASSVGDLIARAPRAPTSPGGELTCGQVDNIFEIGSVLMQPYNPGVMTIRVRVMQTTNAAGTAYAVKWSKHVGPDGMGAAPTVPAGLSRSLGEHVVVAEVRYNYVGALTQWMLTGGMTFSETFHFKPRNGTVDIAGRSGQLNFACP
jgi:hypothetical protein